MTIHELRAHITALEAKVAECEKGRHVGKCAFCGFRIDMRDPDWREQMERHFEECELHPMAVKLRALRHEYVQQGLGVRGLEVAVGAAEAELRELREAVERFHHAADTKGYYTTVSYGKALEMWGLVNYSDVAYLYEDEGAGDGA